METSLAAPHRGKCIYPSRIAEALP